MKWIFSKVKWSSFGENCSLLSFAFLVKKFILITANSESRHGPQKESQWASEPRVAAGCINHSAVSYKPLNVTIMSSQTVISLLNNYRPLRKSLMSLNSNDE
jgi:hypothetical protein